MHREVHVKLDAETERDSHKARATWSHQKLEKSRKFSALGP